MEPQGEHHYLIPESGPVRQLPVDRAFLIGRHSDCDLVVRIEDVSRRHAELRREPGGFVLDALGRQGTYLNGRAVEPSQRPALRTGDELRLGAGFRAHYLQGNAEALRRFVLQREQQLTGAHRTGDAGKSRRATQRAQEDASGLTPREREVSRLVIAGLSNTEIGRELEISVSTVKLHLRNAYAKTGTQGRTELAAFLLTGDLPAWQGPDAKT